MQQTLRLNVKMLTRTTVNSPWIQYCSMRYSVRAILGDLGLDLGLLCGSVLGFGPIRGVRVLIWAIRPYFEGSAPGFGPFLTYFVVKMVKVGFWGVWAWIWVVLELFWGSWILIWAILGQLVWVKND